MNVGDLGKTDAVGRFGRAAAVVLAVALLVAGCDKFNLDPRPETDRFGAVAEKIRTQLEERARKLSYKKPDAEKPGEAAQEAFWQPIIIGGDRQEDIYTGLGGAPLDIQLQFENADIRQVVTTVLGDLMNVEYTLDPALEGTINLRTGRGVSPRSLMTLLKDAVEKSGGIVERVGGLYQIRRTAPQAPGETTVAGEPVTFLPVHKTSATQIKDLLEAVFGARGKVGIDEERNRLIIRGPADLRDRLSAAARQFDKDFMSGRKVSILPLKRAEVRSVFIELLEILGAEAKHGLQVLPIERLNSLLVAAPTQAQVDKVWRYVEGLDRVRFDGQNFHIIQLQYARATEIATLLSKTIAANVEVTVVEAAGAAQSGAAANSKGSAGGKGGAAGAAAASSGGGSLTGPRIVAHEAANSLLVHANPEQFASIQAAVTKLDVPEPQVLIEASILEVTLNDQLEFGVQGFLERFGGKAKYGFFGGDSQVLTGTFPGFNFMFTEGGTLKGVLNALKTVTDVRLLSSPSLVTTNHGQASLEVGDEVPILTKEVTDAADTNSTIAQTVEYRQTGVILKVTPHINKERHVTLDISQEVTSVPTADTTNLTPTLSRRVIETRASVQTGQPIALGGLISEQVTETTRRVPILGQIPLLGSLFGTSNTALSRTELLVILTPTVFTSANESDAITLELIDRLRSLDKDLKK